MVKVRPDHLKRLARELVEHFPDRFTTDFQNNKKLVDALTNVTSTKFRNRIAGYIIRLKREHITQKSESEVRAHLIRMAANQRVYKSSHKLTV